MTEQSDESTETVTAEWRWDRYYDTPRIDQWVWCPQCGSKHALIVVGQIDAIHDDKGREHPVLPFNEYAMLRCGSCGEESEPRPMYPIQSDGAATASSGAPVLDWLRSVSLRSLVRRLLS